MQRDAADDAKPQTLNQPALSMPLLSQQEGRTRLFSLIAYVFFFGQVHPPAPSPLVSSLNDGGCASSEGSCALLKLASTRHTLRCCVSCVFYCGIYTTVLCVLRMLQYLHPRYCVSYACCRIYTTVQCVLCMLQYLHHSTVWLTHAAVFAPQYMCVLRIILQYLQHSTCVSYVYCSFYTTVL
ncbi:unnamed protein product, partial [Discosporangium mesarthrocarpum]